MINVNNYSDFREFLKAYYEWMKDNYSYFSYRYWAQKAGINSSSFYKQIIEGKRNLTKQTISKTCKALKLADAECEYFEYLVFYNQAQSPEEKDLYFAKMIETRRKTEASIIPPSQFEYFSKWYHCVIREIITQPSFDGDETTLQDLLVPRVSLGEIRESVQLLQDLKFVEKTGSGFIQLDPILSSGGATKNRMVIEFQKEMLQRAIEAYSRFKNEDKLMASTTLTLSKENFEKIKGLLRKVKAQGLEMAGEEQDAEAVYQLCINLFPISKSL